MNNLLAELYWLEYLEIAEEANTALEQGDKLKALGLAILAHKAKNNYEKQLNKILFGV